jgi:hypothetical protein
MPMLPRRRGRLPCGRSNQRSCQPLGLSARRGLSRRTRRAAFAKRLGGLGWVEGRSIAIEYRWAEGVVARRRDRAEYAQQKVDVIVVSGDAQVLAAKRATAVIPIVIAASADPVGNGLGESLARPGGSVTCDAVSPFPGQDSQRRKAGDVGIEQTRKFKLVTTL